ncbi:MAG: bifunctional 5,10-methylenetetrahydrofolate dehydrogenase/5,10-methenyltetrahydrofolate cyclohydrolase [Candidatus Omnitrophica bacterium]|nr:bifunctional 5,10-methylenetetrahydrofolate dehydrogenase/5,10-methenyltetrahydrofolate cyclohydrolase [Candidatus Omnitrophota bacterium]
MAAKLLDGKALAANLKEKIKNEIQGLKARYGAAPKLVSVQVGENPASEVYLKSQRKNAENLGVEYHLEKLDAAATQEGLIKTIDKLNKDKNVHGIMIQMPLPKQIDAKLISRYITPLKDVEAVHPQNMGEIVFGNAKILPCTASSCMELLNSIDGLKLYGKEAVVVGHSEIVGKPLALLLLDKFATTTVCHIATGERGRLQEFVKNAEILIVAVGKAGLIKGEWVKEGAIVIDVGINRVEGKLVGDVEFDKAKVRASYITPVPGGVGPLTVAMLMKNLVEAYKIQASLFKA